MMGERTNGYVTPTKRADFLSHHAHLIGIVGDVKYYDFNNMGFKVIRRAGIVAQVERISIEEARRIVGCSILDFGGF